MQIPKMCVGSLLINAIYSDDRGAQSIELPFNPEFTTFTENLVESAGYQYKFEHNR